MYFRLLEPATVTCFADPLASSVLAIRWRAQPLCRHCCLLESHEHEETDEWRPSTRLRAKDVQQSAKRKHMPKKTTEDGWGCLDQHRSSSGTASGTQCERDQQEWYRCIATALHLDDGVSGRSTGITKTREGPPSAIGRRSKWWDRAISQLRTRAGPELGGFEGDWASLPRSGEEVCASGWGLLLRGWPTERTVVQVPWVAAKPWNTPWPSPRCFELWLGEETDRMRERIQDHCFNVINVLYVWPFPCRYCCILRPPLQRNGISAHGRMPVSARGGRGRGLATEDIVRIAVRLTWASASQGCCVLNLLLRHGKQVWWRGTPRVKNE